MFVIFLAGGIASGKSTVAAELASRGAWRIDLDQLSRDVCTPYTGCLADLAAAFGDDILDENGELIRHKLAERAFADDESCALLESIELPYIKNQLAEQLTCICCAATSPEVAVVEIPLLDRMEDMMNLANEVVVVLPPVELRRRRAMGRGVSLADFEARREHQPSDDYLRERATYVIENAGDRDALAAEVDAFWNERVANREGRGADDGR